jgi:hypothetical protein
VIPVFNERVTIEPLLARVRRASTLDLALRAGFARAKGDVVLVQDADLEYNPKSIPGSCARSWTDAPTSC